MKLWQPAALFAGILVALYGTTGYGWTKEEFAQVEQQAASIRERAAQVAKVKSRDT